MPKSTSKMNMTEMYLLLRRRFGFLNWWPGETRDEIIIGAILTQNTSWKNVEKAITNLKVDNMLTLKGIAHAERRDLEMKIRPSGFYRQKAARLKVFANYVLNKYKSLDVFFKKSKEELREELLEIEGIGMETADSILLYAAEKPVFVIDAYTKRIMHRVYDTGENVDYEYLQRLIMSEIKHEVLLYKDFHAQFVELAKNYCKKKPECAGCPLNSNCNFCIHPVELDVTL